MVAQKFACVTLILLIFGSCVRSLPEESSSTKAPPALIAPSPGNSSARGLVLTNVIKVPDNCPEGQQMAVDGVCRDVFD